MSILWTDEGRGVAEDVVAMAPGQTPLEKARAGRVEALRKLAARRAKGESELISRAKRRHQRLMRRFAVVS